MPIGRRTGDFYEEPQVFRSNTGTSSRPTDSKINPLEF